MNNSKECRCVTYIRTGNKAQLNESNTKITDVILKKLKDNEVEKNSMDETSYSIYWDVLRYIEEDVKKRRGEKIKLGKKLKNKKK